MKKKVKTIGDKRLITFSLIRIVTKKMTKRIVKMRERPKARNLIAKVNLNGQLTFSIMKIRT